MKTHDVQSVCIARPSTEVFGFIAKPENLPLWTAAFRRADRSTAELATPEGSVPIKLQTSADPLRGTIDWAMTFPDGATAMAYSRVTADGPGSAVYSFVLMAPPVALEALEGALATQVQTLAKELQALKALLEP